MAEKFTLTTPVVPTSITDYRVDEINMKWGAQLLTVVLVDNTGVATAYVYSGDVAVAKIVALNKVNLSTKSLQKRVLEALVADGKLVLQGSITGSPD